MASTDLLLQSTAGAAFGAALTASGVWSPSIIVAQMQLQDFHMVKVFLAASSASAIFLHLLSRTGHVPIKPRTESSLITSIPYDGNVLGGAMIGCGMTLTGACPGTVLIQVATNTYPGVYSFIGGVAGGIIYMALGPILKRENPPVKSDDSHFLHGKFKVNVDVAVLAYEAICVAVISLATLLAPMPGQNSFLPPIVGGLGIGVAQLASLLLRRAPVGISSMYGELGAVILSGFTKGEKDADGNPKKPSIQAIAFSAGVMAGAAALVRFVPRFAVESISDNLGISPLRAVVGGTIMVFGARLAGGCTSGHGISGMSTLATASVVTVVSMFAGGMGLAQLMA